MFSRLSVTFFLLLNGFSLELFANNVVHRPYTINPGDILSISVWGEESLSPPEVLVRPDGMISLPIVGETTAGEKTVEELQNAITDKLRTILKDDPVVSVSTLRLTGNTIFVLGQVAKPGEFIMRKDIDVIKALALAGGLGTFADANDIKIIRRDSEGNQRVFSFRYDKVKSGKKLGENILLESGDVVLVP